MEDQLISPAEKQKIATQIVQKYQRFLLLVSAIFLVILSTVVFPNWYVLNISVDGVEFVDVAVEEEDNIYDEDVLNGVHVPSGLIADEGYDLVLSNCTACHSVKLVTQNKGTEEDWKSIIKWMQETQNLWDLGENESPLVKYLAKNYGPTKKSRRANLLIEEWYELD